MKKIYLLIVLLVSLNSCFQPPEAVLYQGDLFPLTLTGSQRLAFLANGEIWVPDQPSSLYAFVSSGAINTRLELYAFSYNQREGWLDIEVLLDNENYLPIEWNITMEHCVFSTCSEYNSQFFQSTFDNKDTVFPFTFDLVKLDTTARIVSGFFEIPELVDQDGTILNITQGRFDIAY